MFFDESKSGHFANSISEYSGTSGVSVYESSPSIINSVLANNDIGLHVDGITAIPVVTNCVFWGNSNIGIHGVSTSSPIVTNCILWENGDDLYNSAATYSDIEDGDAGTGNIQANPMFVDAVNGDFHLQATSPAINAGSNSAPYLPDYDFEGDPRILPPAGIVDMGADEFVPSNMPPVADPGGPYTTDLNTPVPLDGSGSYDPNEGAGDFIVSYEWIVGSGTLILSGQTPSLSAAQVNSLGVGIHPVSLTVTDEFGATGMATTTLTVNAVAPADPQEMTENLIEVVGSLDLPEGIQNSLTSKLSNVIKSLEKGQTNAAINQLNAFINEVQAQSGKKLTSEQANMLILEATRIIERCRAI